MKCEVCGKGMAEGVSLFRQNELGVTGIWRCREHNEKPPEPEVDDIVRIIEGDNACRKEDKCT